MDKKEKKHVLKIFSGPHMGAEIPLGEGPYIIGADDECDIILNDPEIARRHLKISIANGDMHIATMDDAAYIDGEKVMNGEVALLAYQIVTIGTTHLVIGPAGKSWPQIRVPDITLFGRPGQEPEQEPQEVPETEAAPVEEPERDTNRKILLSLGGGLFLLIMLFLFLLLSGGDTDLSSAVPDKTRDVQALRGTLQGLGLPDLQVISSENGRVTVQGYVETSEQKRGIVKVLRTYDLPLRIRVHSTEELASASREVLRAMGLQLDVRPAGPGIISIHGYVRDKAELDKTLVFIRQDIPTIRGIENQVMTGQDLVRVLFGMLGRSGLGPKIRLQAYPDHILATGSLNEQELGRWHEIKEAFFSEYSGLVEIKEQLIPAKPEKTRASESIDKGEKERSSYEPVLDIKGVSTGAVRYMTLADGTRCFEGAKLKNGYVVKRIEHDRIILKKGDREINLAIGE